MSRRLVRFVIALASGLLVNAVILSLAYAFGFWLGRNADNLWLLLRLTVPFCVLLGLVAAIWPESKQARIRTSPLGLAILGVSLSCGYWYLIGRATGLGFLGFAIQAFACWIGTAVAALLLAISRRSRGVLIGVVVVSVLAVVVPSLAFNYFSRNQRLTVAFVVPEELGTAGGPQQIGFDSQSEVEETTRQVLQSIRMSGTRGNYRVVHLSRQGEGKESLAIVVVNAPVNGRTLLPEPNAAELIYVQQPQGWAKSPAQAATLHRSIEIWGYGDRDDSLAYFGIPDASGVSLIGRIRKSGTKGLH